MSGVSALMAARLGDEGGVGDRGSYVRPRAQSSM